MDASTTTEKTAIDIARMALRQRMNELRAAGVGGTDGR